MILKEMKNIEKNKVQKKRETFSSGIAVFFATLSSAVGLGNIWKFPSMVGTNGGGAFILVYLVAVLLVSLPVMISEFYIGRRSRRNTVGAFDKLNAPPFFKIVGYLGVISTSLILFFYSAVSGWVYSYLFKAIKTSAVSVSYSSVLCDRGLPSSTVSDVLSKNTPCFAR